MEITIITFFIGLAILLFLLGKHYFEMKEAGPFTAGFILVLLSVLVLTTGIQYKTGESCTTFHNTSDVCEITSFTYSDVGTIERVSSSGIFFITGFILFLTGYLDRNKRIDLLK